MLKYFTQEENRAKKKSVLLVLLVSFYYIESKTIVVFNAVFFPFQILQGTWMASAPEHAYYVSSIIFRNELSYHTQRNSRQGSKEIKEYFIPPPPGAFS